MSKFKIAWIQGKSQGSIELNKEYYFKKISDASKTGAEFIVLPELFLTDYFAIQENKDNFNLALEISSKIIFEFKELSKNLNIYLTLPIFEKRDGGMFHNTILLINSNGELQSTYRKMHIPDDPGFNEKYYFTPGDLGFVVEELPFCKLGMLICWDQWFPEAARINALKGADLLIYPTAIGWDSTESSDVYEEQLDAWITMLRSHAIANNIHVLAVNRVGKEGHLTFWGNSILINPYGKVISNSKLEEGIFSHEVNLDLKEEARKIWPFFRDRRIDKYDTVLKIWDK